jgi:hypothetical protein
VTHTTEEKLVTQSKMRVNQEEHLPPSSLNNNNTTPMVDFHTLVQQHLQEYIYIDGEIRSVMPFLNTDTQFKQLQHQVTVARKEMNTLVSQKVAEKQKLDTYKNGYLSQWMARVQSKHESYLQEYESAYNTAVTKEQEAIQKVDNLQNQLSQLRIQLEQLPAMRYRFNELKYSMDILLDKIFDNIYDTYPQLYLLAQELKQRELSVKSISQALNDYQECERCLAQAQAALQFTSSKLQTVGTYNDLFFGADIFLTYKYPALNEARAAAESAQTGIQRAIQLVPSLSGAIFTAYVTEGAFLMELIFDNIFTELYVGDKIHKSREQVRISLQTVSNALGFIRGSLNTIVCDLNSANQQLSNLKNRVDLQRHNIIKEYLPLEQ